MKILPRYSLLIYCLVGAIILVINGCANNSQTNSQEENLTQKQIIDTIYKQQKMLNLCNQEKDQDLSTDSAKIYPFNQQKYLAEILCFLGAYQPNYQYFFVEVNSDSNFEIQPLIFTTFQAQQEDLKLTNTRTLTGTVNFVPETQTLTVETKGRGLGDCGSFAIYQWENNSFNLQEFRYKGDCNGVYIHPEEYPLIYP